MKGSSRIIFNALASYGASVIQVAAILFSSRWVLQALGEVDYGLFALVGSIVFFMTFLNAVLASSASRYLAYAIGEGQPDQVNLWFNANIGAHAVLACILVVLGYPIGEYAIAHFLTVPESRLAASLWVFRLSLLSAFVSMLAVPFQALFRANQRMGELALWDVIRTVLVLFLAYGLLHVNLDRLLVYACGMVAIMALISISLMIRALVRFDEVRIRYRLLLDWSRTRQLLSFTVWNLIGATGSALRNQGSAILLNLYFGPIANASYGIARRVSVQADRLSASLLGAISPEITSREAGGDRHRMLELALRACKFGTLLVLVFAVPLIVEMDYILGAWLVSVPAQTAPLCRLILCSFLVDRLSIGFMMAVNAHGRIAAYQATVGTTLLMTLPLAWLFVALGAPLWTVGVAFVCTMALCSLGRAFWARRLIGLPVRRWLSEVVKPSTAVGLASTVGALLFYMTMQQSLLRLVLVTLSSVTICGLLAWGLVLDSRERAIFKSLGTRIASLIVARPTTVKEGQSLSAAKGGSSNG